MAYATLSRVLFFNTCRTHPCPVFCFLTLGVRTPAPCYARKYFGSFCFVVLRFLTLGVCTRVPNYVFQHMAYAPLFNSLCSVVLCFQHLSYAPLSRLMPANTSTAVALWCCVFQHLAYAPPVPCCPPVLQQLLCLFCCVMLSNTWRTPPCPALCPPYTNCMNRQGKPCRVQS